MNNKMNIKGLFKKALAVFAGLTVALSGAAMLPGNLSEDSYITAGAENIFINNCIFTAKLMPRTQGPMVKITAIEPAGDTVEIPSTMKIGDTEYPVYEIGLSVLKGNQDVKTVIVPDSVGIVAEHFLEGSSVEHIVLSDNLIYLGTGFANDCPNLESVECNKLDLPIYEMGFNIMTNCPKMFNDKGAVCLANWLVAFDPARSDDLEIRIADLSDNGIKIDSIGHSVIINNNKMTKVDLEGIKQMGSDNFYNCSNLRFVVNGDDLKNITNTAFLRTPWFNKACEKPVVRLGSVLLYYRTDSDTIDINTDELKDVTCIIAQTFCDCKNADTLYTNKNQRFAYGCFYRSHDQTEDGLQNTDPLPITATYKIKNIYLDNKKLEFTKENPLIDEWMDPNFDALIGTQWLMDTAEAKTRALFEQLSIPYYGVYNDKAGTLSPTEEFYTVMKIHDYISTYEYDLTYEYANGVEAFLLGTPVMCGGYSSLQDYLFECAGVDAMMIDLDVTYSHEWNEVKIGDEWFICDAGWDAQSAHKYDWFCLSSSSITDPTHRQEDGLVIKSWHDQKESSDYQIAERLLGDTNHRDVRDEDSVNAVWNQAKRTNSFYTRNSDINFDGKVDVTDAVLLENIIFGTAVDEDNIPEVNLAPGFKTVLINGTDRESMQYFTTDRDGYLVLPECPYEAPEGMKLKGYNLGKPGKKVKIHDPYTVISPVWVDINAPDEPDSSEPESSLPDSSKPDSSNSSKIDDSSSKTDDSSSKPDKTDKLGDVNNDGKIDIEDAVTVIQHINGVRALTADEKTRANVSGDTKIDIDDAVMIISYVNGNKLF